MKIDRVGATLELFTHAYFSFLPTTHRVWSQTADMINLHWEVCMDSQEMLSLQERMLDALRSPPSSRFPVSGYHRYCAAEWLELLSREGGWELCRKTELYPDRIQCNAMSSNDINTRLNQ